MIEADPSNSTPAHEFAVVIRSVVVRMFIRHDETCWISAGSIARLVQADALALCAEFPLGDLAWIASRHDHVDPHNDVRLSTPVISARAFSEMGGRYPVLGTISGELNSEVFAAFHERVMRMRRDASAAAANDRSMEALKALAAVLASRTCQEAHLSDDAELIQAVDRASAVFASFGVEGGAQ